MPPAEPVVAVSPVSVLGAGGTQLQARAKDTVHKSMKEDHPRIRAHRIRMGWSSIWQRRFVEMKREMKGMAHF